MESSCWCRAKRIKFLVKSYTKQNNNPFHPRALTNKLMILYNIPMNYHIHHTGEEPK